MLLLSQDQSCGALLGDCLQPVAPAGFVFFFLSFFLSVHEAQTASQKSEGMLLLCPLAPRPIPQAEVRVRGCLPAEQTCHRVCGAGALGLIIRLVWLLPAWQKQRQKHLSKGDGIS